MQNAPFYPPPAGMGMQQPPYLSMGPYGQPMRGPGGMLPQRGMPLNPGKSSARGLEWGTGMVLGIRWGVLGGNVGERLRGKDCRGEKDL
jgi:hypothetical protein